MLTLLFLLVFPVASDAAAADAEFAPADSLQRPEPRSALLRSAILPGWGQYYNKQPLKAALFGAAGAGCLSAAILEARSLSRAQTPAEHENRAGRRNAYFLCLALTATAAAIEAYVEAHLADFVSMAEVDVEADGAFLQLNVSLRR